MCTVIDISWLVKSSRSRIVCKLPMDACSYSDELMNYKGICFFSFCVIISGSRNLLCHVHFCFMFIRTSYQPKNTAMQSNQTTIKVLFSLPDKDQFVKLRVG